MPRFQRILRYSNIETLQFPVIIAELNLLFSVLNVHALIFTDITNKRV